MPPIVGADDGQPLFFEGLDGRGVRQGLQQVDLQGLTQREHLTEIVELPQNVHPWFMGVQFHPEFKSTPWGGHPLFNAFIAAALEHQGADKDKKTLKAVA